MRSAASHSLAFLYIAKARSGCLALRKKPSASAQLCLWAAASPCKHDCTNVRMMHYEVLLLHRQSYHLLSNICCPVVYDNKMPVVSV